MTRDPARTRTEAIVAEKHKSITFIGGIFGFSTSVSSGPPPGAGLTLNLSGPLESFRDGSTPDDVERLQVVLARPGVRARVTIELLD